MHQDEVLIYERKRGGPSMSQKAVNVYVQQEFSESVEMFLARSCRVGTGLSISDKKLFPVFQAFWTSTATETQHPALLGQFGAIVSTARLPFIWTEKTSLVWFDIASIDSAERPGMLKAHRSFNMPAIIPSASLSSSSSSVSASRIIRVVFSNC